MKHGKGGTTMYCAYVTTIKKEKTIISITHNLNEAKYADRVIVMNKGKIVINIFVDFRLLFLKKI